jgi:hypothetical protein
MSNIPLPMALFSAKDGKIQLQLKLVDETLWLTQWQIAELYEKTPPTIIEHLKNIYEEGELSIICPQDNLAPKNK